MCNFCDNQGLSVNTKQTHLPSVVFGGPGLIATAAVQSWLDSHIQSQTFWSNKHPHSHPI